MQTKEIAEYNLEKILNNLGRVPLEHFGIEMSVEDGNDPLKETMPIYSSYIAISKNNSIIVKLYSPDEAWNYYRCLIYVANGLFN